MLVHRYVYELLVGPIPEGRVLDHLCGEHLCCRPSHLEPVTIVENSKRRWHRPTVLGAAAVAYEPITPEPIGDGWSQPKLWEEPA